MRWRSSFKRGHRLVPDLLTAEGLCAGYGDSTVLEGVSFALEQGGSLALIGRNGVGKTTLLLTLMGLTRLRRGRLFMRGRDISHKPTYLRARSGLGATGAPMFPVAHCGGAPERRGAPGPVGCGTDIPCLSGTRGAQAQSRQPAVR